MYCSETNVSPYKGEYGEQPALWVDTYFIIKRAFAKRESKVIESAKRRKKTTND